MARLLAAVVMLGALTLIGPAGALAQDATPAATAGVAPDPAECRTEPISADELIALWFPENESGTPVPATRAVSPPMDNLPLPLGEPADAATVAGVVATVRELYACQNLGENGRFFAFFTDDALRGFGPPPEFGLADMPAILTGLPEPVPAAERVRLLAVTDVSVMADGRIGAIVISDDPPIPPEGPQTTLVLFVEEGGRWLIDELVLFTAAEEVNGGTPAP